MDNKNYGILMSLALAGVMLGIRAELSSLWAVEQNWEKLLSAAGMISLGLYLLFLGWGLFMLVMGAWRIQALNRMARRFTVSLVFRWLTVAGLLLVFTYLHLFSVWQPILTQPWIQFLFAAGFAQTFLLVIAPQREQRFGGSEVALTLGIFLYPRIIQEMRALYADATVYRAATAAGFIFILGLVSALYSTHGEKIRLALVTWRERLGSLRFVVIALLCLAPIFYRYLVSPETYILYDDIRFAILIVVVWVMAFLGLTGSNRLVSPEALGLSLGLLLFTSFLARSSLFVIDYPFTLYWSEGNRFYDYSLVFGQSLYNYEGHIVNPYTSPGRYGLWGALFLWNGLPIWAHRLWNLILQTLPVLIFAALLTRKLKPPALRYGMLIWITLFLTVLAPLHPPFILASAVVVLFAFDESLLKRGLSLAVAGFYVSLTRWTWAFAPAAMGALIELLLYYPRRTGPLWRRLLPSMTLVVTSLIAALFLSLESYFSLAQGDLMTASQPLLWYRLLPNDTLGPGVLFLSLRYTLPLLILLTWWMISRRWQLDWIQKLAILGTLTGFFAAGLVISTKIGGGGDLHNLDMYLVTLLVIMVLGLMSLNDTSIQPRWPAWAVALVSFLIFWVVYPFTPLHPSSDYHPWLNLPNDNQVAEALSRTREEVTKFAAAGEVLFMDHRQLLTFGYIPAVSFIPEYEKKYMMDQAMGSNARYFRSYYQDLANQRFALIVTEPLRTRRREELGGPFSEENDAWVLWVSNPTLCFYEPVYVSTEVNVELLVPRQNPLGCEEYLR